MYFNNIYLTKVANILFIVYNKIISLWFVLKRTNKMSVKAYIVSKLYIKVLLWFRYVTLGAKGALRCILDITYGWTLHHLNLLLRVGQGLREDRGRKRTWSILMWSGDRYKRGKSKRGCIWREESSFNLTTSTAATTTAAIIGWEAR